MKWLKHAFAVDPPGPVAPTQAQAALVERLAHAVVRRGLSTPAVIALECSHNLNFLASQALVFFAPILKVIFNPVEYEAVVRFLEQRGSIEYICRRIEAHADGEASGDAAPSPIGSDRKHDRDTP